MNKRELLERCLDSIFKFASDLHSEVLVLDNASSDGSAEMVSGRFGDKVNLIVRDRRLGKAENDSQLLLQSRGQYCLLLNDDSELTQGAVEALVKALDGNASAAAAGAQLLSPESNPQPSAWHFPGIFSAVKSALALGRIGVVQSKGAETRLVDWAQSAALMVRKAAFDDVGDLDPQFFVYSDEVDWCKRAHDKGWQILYVPDALVYHHEQLAGSDVPERRIVEFSRNRDLYVRKHHGALAALAVRLLTAWSYTLRAVAAAVMPDQDAKRYWFHVRKSLNPNGEGLREAAEEFNQTLL